MAAPIARDTKFAAIADYYMTRNSIKTAEKFGIGSSTIREWMNKDPEAMEIMAQLREENEEDFRVKSTYIIQHGLDQLEDRVTKGEMMVERKDGESIEYRVPMTSKALTYTVGVQTDKLRVSLNLPTRISKSDGSSENMREEFMKLSREIRGVTEKRIEESIEGEKD